MEQTRRNIPPLKSISAFESVVRLGSVTKAAEELFITHGAVSKRIAALEEWLGRPLFEANRRQMRPLPEARDWAATLGELLDRLDGSAAVLRDASRLRPLRVIAPSTLAARWLVPRSWHFSERHRDIALQVRHTDTGEDWRAMPFDVAIRTDGDSAGPLQSAKLFDEELTLALAPALAAEARLWRPADILGVRLLGSQTRSGELERWLGAAGLSGAGAAPTTFPHFYLALEACLAGTGALVCPRSSLADLFARGDLIEPWPEITVPGPTFRVLWNGEAPSEDVRLFLRWLDEVTAARAPATASGSS